MKWRDIRLFAGVSLAFAIFEIVWALITGDRPDGHDWDRYTTIAAMIVVINAIREGRSA